MESMKAIKDISLVITSLLPVIAFVWWVVWNILSLSGRTKNSEDDINDLNQLKLPENIKDHDRRITLLEHAYHTTTVKLDQLIGAISEIKGLLEGKKDKQ
jgi:hypothetical protein